MGFCNYYRELVPRFAELACHLYPLGKLDKIQWTQELRDCFERLRQAVLAAPILKFPDHRKPFILETDASAFAVGGVLKQVVDSKECPVLFFSHTLSKAERNYSTYERELLALVKSLAFFSIYLLYNTFVWRTDHAALKNLFKSDLKLSSRVSRWILALQPYKIIIEQIKGKDNILADALSRVQTEGLSWSLSPPRRPQRRK